eukprot:GEZU01017744.1.p1 GENE.GEZU01017744.1~~GEZU01017744.1.p1  ORF type:complete len:473 (-),score=59.32 GEZU01017744.1:360-1778(-)
MNSTASLRTCRHLLLSNSLFIGCSNRKVYSSSTIQTRSTATTQLIYNHNRIDEDRDVHLIELSNSNNNEESDASDDNNNSGGSKKQWKDVKAHRQFFDEISKRLNITQFEDWYRVRLKDVYALGGASLLKNYYSSSLSAALAAAYPEHEWQPWRFSKMPSGFWNDVANQRRFFDFLAKVAFHVHEPIEKLPEAWYTASLSEIEKHVPRSLLAFHGFSVLRALQTAYPEHEIDPSRFMPDAATAKRCKRALLKVEPAQIPSYATLAKELDINGPEDWRRKADSVPFGFWNNPENQRQFFDQLGAYIGVKKMEDWYQVKPAEVSPLVPFAILNRHGRNFVAALMSAYSTYPWVPVRFIHTPQPTSKNKNKNRNNNKSVAASSEDSTTGPQQQQQQQRTLKIFSPLITITAALSARSAFGNASFRDLPGRQSSSTKPIATVVTKTTVTTRARDKSSRLNRAHFATTSPARPKGAW